MNRGSFVERNRLIVALANALVVVEYPERSGALISARFAAQLNVLFGLFLVMRVAGRRRGAMRLFVIKPLSS
jgi:hypothetical protein